MKVLHHIRTSLKRKIFLRFTGLVGLAVLATGIFSLMTVRSLVEQEAIEDLIFLARDTGQELERTVTSHKALTQMMAQDTSLKREHLITTKDTFPDMENIALLSPDGTVMVATDSRLDGKSFAHLEQVKRGGNSVTHGPLNLLSAQRTYVISAPVRNAAGELTHILLAEFRTESLLRAITGEKSVGDTGAFLLLEKGGEGLCINPRHIALSIHGTLERESLRFSPSLQGSRPPVCLLASAGKEDIFTSRNAQGRTVLAAHHQTPTIGIGIVATVEEWEIWEPVRLLLAILSGMTCILFLLVALIAYRLADDVIRPILILKKKLRNLNAGAFCIIQNVFTGDELETLDVEVLHLSERLNEAYSSLEKRVEERTRELKAEHAKDAALIESIGEGFLAIDLHGAVIASNHAAETILQWEREQIIGSHFSSVLHLKDKVGKPLSPQEHIIQRALSEKTTIRTSAGATITCERKDGTMIPMSMTATPFLLDMEVQGIVVTLRDITEEKRIDRMKSEFISLASHQLRTPLTAIGWYIELLKGDGDAAFTTDQEEYMAQILQSHGRMVELVNSLLNVSRIELGKVQIEPEEITIEKLVSVPIQNLTPQIEKKKLSLRKRLPDITVKIDPDLVQMVLENLLSNAVKYTPENGSVDLTVIADNAELHFNVKDTGMGIPHAQQRRIFEKLFRADNVVKSDTVGTGIGLYIAKNTVEAWGGKLWFESKEKEGTTFHFSVPRTMKQTAKEGTTEDTTKGSSSPRSK